jgi:hypothetical protein
MKYFILSFLAACGGTTIEQDPPDAAPERSSVDTSPPAEAGTDAGISSDACAWKCVEVSDATTMYQNTCTLLYCPGTGNCAGHFVPNTCADGGS